MPAKEGEFSHAEDPIFWETQMTHRERYSAITWLRLLCPTNSRVYPVIGDMPANEVTADHVVTICKGIEKSGARVQSERTKATIGGTYRSAWRERLVTANPCSGIGRR